MATSVPLWTTVTRTLALGAAKKRGGVASVPLHAAALAVWYSKAPLPPSILSW